MKSALFALAASASTALANVKGFNYGAELGSQAAFEAAFKTAAGLSGTQGFNSARLYTMIQEGTGNGVTEAIPAAIDSKTSLLLGLWASQDQAGFNNEIAALKSAISAHGSDLADLVVGISVGSEDLYRETPTGIENKSGYGQSPSVLVNYIGQVRDAIKGTVLSSKLVGHVDTWNAFVNGTNSPVVQAVDFLGLDEYPYFQTSDANAVDNAGNLFFQAYDKVQAIAGGKEIWITEAGWPVSGPASGQAIASTANAEIFWQDVFCQLESRNINTWWFTLNDNGASPSFSVSQNGKPLYNLACNATSSTTSSSSSSSTSGPSSSSSSSSGGSSSSSSSAAGGSGSSSSSSSSASTSGSSSTGGGYTNGTSSGSGSGSSTSSGTGSTGSSSGSSTSSPSSSVSPSTNGAGKIEGGIAVILMVVAATLLL